MKDLSKKFLALRGQPGLRGLFLLAATFFSLILIFSLHRYWTFYASFDQGIFNQVFWNNLHSRFFQSSLSSSLSTFVVHDQQVPEVFYRRLGQHFTPALLLWLPFYAIYPHAVTLVFLQVTLVTAAGIALYFLARRYLQPPLALMITASFYASNAVIGPTFSNFHDSCQTPLFIFGIFLAMEYRRWWIFWPLAVLTLAVREDAGIVLFGVGMYMVLSRRFPKAGLALCSLSFGYVLLCTNVLMPLFSPDISKRFMIERFGKYADGDEATTVEIIWGIVSHPERLVVGLLTPFDKKIFYIAAQTLPFVFVPLLSGPTWMIAGFPLLQLFLQQGQSPLAIHIRYAITLVPGIAYGAILWWSQNPHRFRPRLKSFWTGCLILSVLIAIAYSPHRVFYFIFPDSYRPWVHVSLPRQWEHSGHIRALLDKIPPEPGVSATTFIVPHLSSRRELLRLPALQVRNDQREVVDVEYAIADFWQLQQYEVAFQGDRDKIKQITPVFDQILAQGRYGVQEVRDGVVLLQKNVASNPQALADWSTLRRSLEPILQKP